MTCLRYTRNALAPYQGRTFFGQRYLWVEMVRSKYLLHLGRRWNWNCKSAIRFWYF